MARLAQQFRNDFVNLRNSPTWNDLSKEEQQDITQKAKLLLQALHERDSFPEMNEAQAIAETEQQFLEKNRADQGPIEKYVTAPFRRGMSNLAAVPAKLAAFGLDVVGADETANEMRKDVAERQQVVSETVPGLGKSYSELTAGDVPQFITDVVGENLPTMLLTGLAGRAITGASVAGKVISPTVAGTTATYGLMSLPEVYTSVKEAGGGAGSAALFAAPHAIIENLGGITPTKVVSWFKRGAAKEIASKGLKNFLFDTFKGVLGEGSEEVAQGMVEMAARHFSTKPYDQAVKDFANEVTSPEAIEQMKTEFAGGAAFGVAGGGVGAVQRYADIQQKRQAIAQRKGGREFIAKVTKIVNADAGLSEQMTELKKMYSQETEPGRKEHIMQTMQQLQRAKRGAPSILEPSEQAQNEILTNLRAPTMQRQAEDAQGMAQNQAFAQSFVEPTPETGTIADYLKYQAEKQQPAPQQPVESYEYPTGAEGLRLMLLDDLERRQQPNQSVVYDPNATENIPRLTYQQAAVEGRQLPDGGIVKESKNDDIITLKSGEPFKSQKAAQGYQAKNNLKASHDIVATRGGWVLMKKAAQQQAKRITVETPRGGTYDKMTVSKNISTENRMRVSGTPDVAERIEKRLAPSDMETETPADQTTIKQPAPVIEPKAKAVQPAQTKPVKQPANSEPVSKSAYKVESYQGGFRVLDPEGKQYSWHTSKQAADSKAADLNSGKTAPTVAPKAETKAETKPIEPQQTTRITAENAETLANAQRLRKSAASLLEQAQADLNRDRQTNTARRARMAAGATDDAANREAFAKTMNNLADAMERGEVRYLKGVKSRPDLMLFKNELTAARRRYARKNDLTYDQEQKIETTEDIIRVGAEFNRPHPYGDWFDHAARELETIQGMKPAAAYIEKLGRGNRSRNVSLSDEAIGKILDIKKTIAKKGIKTPYQFARILETIEDYQKLRAAGIKSDFDLADALIEYRNLEAGKKQESPLVKAERELIGKKFEGFDFFPTPPDLAERMAQELDIKPGMKVLEPSAGKGDLADAVKAAQPEADVKVIEPLSDLREILTMKNHEVIDTNFENFETDQKFDRIIMNPPFSKNRDIRHVRKAYELLAPGGKMIAIMGNHFTFANDQESIAFREWLDTVRGTSENLGQAFAGKDAFRQTGVNSQLVTIEKPAETSAKAEPAKTEVSGQTLETPSTASDLVRPKDPIQTIRDVYNSNSNFRRGQLNGAFIGRVTRALAPMGVDKWKIDLAVTNIKQRNARASTGVMTWINDDDLIAELLKAGDIKRPAAAVVQTEDRAVVDLIKPEEKDFESATDYLKALTTWREKTGNLTAAEVKRRDRALRFADRAAKTGQKASGLFRQADKISERFYMGQPILVGHHSERGARAAQNRMHNKMDAALKEEKKAEYYSQRAESAEKNKSISSADEDAIVKLKAKLETLSKVQERMKQANKVVKAPKLSDAEKITKLQEQGFSEAKAKNLLEKDFAGRVGFPAYALQNNNAEMSRLKKRIEELSVKQSQQTQKIEFDGGEIVDNVAENRLQIFFDSKPDEATREKLKSNGFRWAPSAGAWQMHRSTWANRKAESITGAKIPAAQPAQAATAEDQYYNDPAETGEPAKAEPVRQLYKNDDIIFRFPDGRETGAYIIDPELKTIDGAPGQVYVKMDNGAVRFIPQDWITKSKHSPMVQNRLDAEKTEASRAAKPAVPVSKNVKVADDGRKVITVFTDYKKAYAAMEKEAGILLTPSQNAEASWWTVYYKSKLIGNLQRSSHESGFLFTYDHDMQQAETEDFAAKRKKTAEELIAEVKSVTRKYLDEDPRFKTRTEIASRDIRAGAGVAALRSAPTPGNAFGKIPGGKNKGFYIGKDGYVLEDATVAIDGRPEIETGYEQRPDVPAINVLIDKYGFDKNATGLIAVPNYSRKGAFGDAFKLFATDGKNAQTIIAGEEISASVQITENPVTGEEVYFNYELLRAAQIELGELSLAQIGKDELNRRAGMFKNKDGRIAIIAEFDAKAGGNDLISQITKASGLGRRGAVLNPAVFAKYAASRIAAKFSAGFELLRSGVTKFADWARAMLKQFGKSIGPKLRAMFADLTAVLQSRRGMIRMGSLGKPGFQPMKVVAGSQMSLRDFENIQGAVFDDDYSDEQPFLTPRQLINYRNRRQNLARLQFDERTMLSEGWTQEEIEQERQAIIRRSAGELSQEEREELARFRNEQAEAYAEIAAREIIEPVSQRAKEASEAFFKEWSERFGGRRGAALNLGGDAMTIFLNGATKFADWARALVKKYGKSINGVLKNMWTSVNNFAKSLGRTGAISGRTVAGKFKAKPAPKVKRAQPAGVPKSFGVQSKDLQWVKDNKKQLRLVYNGQTVATLERKAPGGWRWAEANKAWARNELAEAKTIVKSTIFEELKRAERESAKYKAEADKRQKAEEARNKKHDDYFTKPISTAPAKPKLAFKERIKNFIVKAGDVFVDRWGPALRLQQQVAKNAGIGEVSEGENFYRKLELLANRISNRTEQFKAESFEPIVDYLNKNKISYEQFNRFLRIMHAEERNNHVFEINPEFRRRAAIEPDNPNYAGSGITTKEARAEIERMKQDGTYDIYFAAGKMYWDLNKTLLNMQVKYGLMAPEVRDTLNSKYEYYAPLKSMTEDSTKLDWRALGRRSESSDQLAHTEKAIEATFSYGENARVRRAFARFAINHPMPGVYEINRAVKKPYFDENTGEVKYRLDQYEKREELLFVPTSTGGLVMRIKDPALLAVLKNQNDLQLGDFPGPYLRSLNRFLGAVNTSVNPEFMFVNLLRDIQTAAVSLSAEESSEMAANVVLGIPGAAITAYEFKAGENNADVALYKEFMRQGGKIGYRDIYKLENAAEKLKTRMAETQAGGTWFQTKEGMKAIRDLIVDANDVIESATRFSAYKEARNMGMSKEKAGSIAANVTLNFQKRGTAGQILNAMYLFSTASIGGSARVAAVTAKAATSNIGKALISGAIAFGFMIDIINRILSDIDPDDDRKYWDKISAGEKDMNYMIMLPGQKENPLKLPMPHGFNVFPAIGRNISAMLFGEQTAYESVGNVMNTLLNAFSPIGTDERGIAYSLIPTAIKAPADVMLGRKWTGKRVRPDQPQFGAEMPRSQLINKDTNKMLVGITRALNAIDGDGRRPGTLDFSAADIQYLIEHYLGGAGKTVTRGFDVLWRIGAGQEIPPGNVPFVRRFYGSNTDFEAFDTFKKNRDEVERYNAAKREDDKAWMQANKWLSVARQRYSETDKRLSDIKKDATLNDDQKRDAMMIEQKRFNRDFEKIRKQYQGTDTPVPEAEKSRAKTRNQRKRPTSKRRRSSALFM